MSKKQKYSSIVCVLLIYSIIRFFRFGVICLSTCCSDPVYVRYIIEVFTSMTADDGEINASRWRCHIATNIYVTPVITSATCSGRFCFDRRLSVCFVRLGMDTVVRYCTIVAYCMYSSSQPVFL